MLAIILGVVFMLLICIILYLCSQIMRWYRVAMKYEEVVSIWKKATEVQKQTIETLENKLWQKNSHS